MFYPYNVLCSAMCVAPLGWSHYSPSLFFGYSFTLCNSFYVSPLNYFTHFVYEMNHLYFPNEYNSTLCIHRTQLNGWKNLKFQHQESISLGKKVFVQKSIIAKYNCIPQDIWVYLQKIKWAVSIAKCLIATEIYVGN